MGAAVPVTGSQFLAWVAMVAVVSVARVAWWLARGERLRALAAACQGWSVVVCGCMIVELELRALGRWSE